MRFDWWEKLTRDEQQTWVNYRTEGCADGGEARDRARAIVIEFLIDYARSEFESMDDVELIERVRGYMHE